MSDAGFARWPLGHADDGAAHAAIPAAVGWRLVSTIEPAEAALFSPDAPLGEAIGGARYDLELVSDTGAAVERFGVLMLVAFDVPDHQADMVDRWYREEHIGLLMRADGWLRARRYRVVGQGGGGARWTSMAFHELRDAAVMDSPERAVARSTAWRAELERDPWFRAAGRGVFRPLSAP